MKAEKERVAVGEVADPLPPSPAEECCADSLNKGASGCLVLEDLSCWCLYTNGGGGGTRDINTSEVLDSLSRVER